jgi:hypothetical protein
MAEPEGLEYTAHRVGLALSRRQVMPAGGMTYRLCEVGAPRLDPRVLERHLLRLCAVGTEVVRTEEGLYAHAEMAAPERRNRAAQVVRALEGLELTPSGTSRDNLEIVRKATTGLQKPLEESGWQTDIQAEARMAPYALTRLGDGVSFEIARPSGRAPLLVLLTHSPDWMYPDAPELWAHAREAASREAHPVYLVRKVAPITFPLLSALNARALQYYDLLVPEVPDDAAMAQAESLGLPRLCGAAKLPMHSSFSHLLRLAEERPDDAWVPGASDAFEDAVGRGFADNAVNPSAVADWAEAHADLPPRWTSGMRIWADGRERPAGVVPQRTRKRGAKESEPIFGRTTEVSRVPFKV